MAIETIFADNLIEVLLSVILMFNVGAYSMLWKRTQENRDRSNTNEKLVRQEKANLESELNRIRSDITSIEQKQKGMSETIYGSQKDKTDDGHIFETEEKIDSICDTIEENEERRRSDHKTLMEALTHLADKVLENRIRDVEDILDAD